MKQPSLLSRKEYFDTIVEDRPTIVNIPGTRKKVRISGVKPGTIKALTRLWIKRDLSIPTDTSDTLKSLATDPYFAIKQACLFVLNDYWKIKLFYPIMWRWWGMVKGYTEAQMTPLIEVGKKKIPLSACFMNMALTVDMRTDLVKMTTAEAEQYQAALLSAANQLSSRTTPPMDSQDGSSLDL